MTVTRIRGFDWTYAVLDPEQGLLEVDVAAYAGAGSCQCRTFLFSCKDRLESGERPSDDLRCPHILAVWSHIRDHEFERFASMQRGIRTNSVEIGI